MRGEGRGERALPPRPGWGDGPSPLSPLPEGRGREVGLTYRRPSLGDAQS